MKELRFIPNYDNFTSPIGTVINLPDEYINRPDEYIRLASESNDLYKHIQASVIPQIYFIQWLPSVDDSGWTFVRYHVNKDRRM